MDDIARRIRELQASLPEEVKLVAVSKFHPVEALQEAYAAGQRAFGESRAQELAAKRRVLPDDIEWHFIGPLQSNKVKEIAPFVSLIHSVDSLKLLNEIEKQGARLGRTIRVLLEIHVAEEETKHGFAPDECRGLANRLPELPHVQICGIMGMATLTGDENRIRKEFHALHGLFTELKETAFSRSEAFSILSMGMSDDYKLAIEEGSNMIRVGTLIFGERNPLKSD